MRVSPLERRSTILEDPEVANWGGAFTSEIAAEFTLQEKKEATSLILLVISDCTVL